MKYCSSKKTDAPFSTKRYAINIVSLPVRQRLHSIQIETGMSQEFVAVDAKLIVILEEIVKELGLNSFEDTSTFDWNQMSKNNQIGACSSNCSC